MLNPGFRLLDPEYEQLKRLASLSEDSAPGFIWHDALRAADEQVVGRIAQQAVSLLSRAGIHSASEIHRCLREAAYAAGIAIPEMKCFGWPESLLHKVAAQFSQPRVFLLGILDAAQIWAGAIAGVQGKGIDFVTTLQPLWNDKPELASRQSMNDLAELCQAVKQKFMRPVTGLFIYRDEFASWRKQAWSSETLQRFIDNNTAKLIQD
jgi:hypothetical protein